MSIPVFSNMQALVGDLNSQSDKGREPHARLIIGKTGSGLLPATMMHVSHMLTGNDFDENVWSLNHPDLHFSFPIVLKSGVSSSEDYLTEWRECFAENPFFGLKHWTQFIAGDANKSALIGKDESQKIMHKMFLKSYLGGKKVLIVWKAEQANDTTLNKLLKLIEEPPDNTHIYLLAESVEGLLPTIISRCQIAYLSEPKHEELTTNLVDRFETDQDRAQNMAALAEGDYFLASELLSDSGNSAIFHQLFVAWMRMCYKKALPDIIDWVESANDLKRERQKDFLLYCTNFFRQCMLSKYLGDEHALLFGDEKQFADNFGKFVHGGNVVQLMEAFDTEYYNLERNGNGKLIFLNLSFDVIKLLHKDVPYVEA